MNNEETAQGNPEAVDESVFGSNGEDFFSALENDVNSIVQEPEKPETQTEVTPNNQGSNQTVGNEASVSQSSENTELDNLKKRYSDSSREAQNLKAQLDELKPFVPVLDAMKQDSGLVSHVRNYFENGGEFNDNIKDQLKLDEDFAFDPDDMVNNPDSDSRKVFDTMVDRIVQNKTNQMAAEMQQREEQKVRNDSMNAQAKEFAERNNLTKEEFQNFITEANDRFRSRGMTFDDMWLIVNKDKAAQNVANSTKQDMLNQMKNVREIPTSQSASNNAGKSNNANDSVFDALLNSDGNIEELLG